ncbi:ABC transporter permease [Pseudogracilibacillus sp. ICA-222130]|uniref:ABC transporter permease n=1 Tax=Pseudogracilibacillus sp. ICA-222130 TaxID=3134655 RepID=UPI0030BA4547
MTENKAKESLLLKVAKHREFGLIVFIILLSIIIQVINSSFLTLSNLNDLLTNTSILIILSIGMLMILLTRGIDLSIAATLALSGMITAQMLKIFPETHPIIAILIGVGIGIICGLILGILVSKIGILPIIASLGLMYVYRGLTFMVAKGEWVNAHQMPASFKAIATSKILGVNTLIFIAIIVFLFFWYFMTYTITGRRIYAVGSNPESAIISGIKVDRILILVYCMMGGLAGLSGVLWVSQYASAQGNTASGYELTVIAACILGGVSINGGIGKITGVLLGAILLGILNNALPLIHVSPFWQMAIEGGIILFAVIFNVIVNRRYEENQLLRRVI